MPKPSIDWTKLIYIGKEQFKNLFIISKALWISIIQNHPIEKELIGNLCISIQSIFETNQTLLGTDLNDIMSQANKKLKEIEEEKNKGISGLKKKILDILNDCFGSKEEIIEDQDLYCINEDILQIYKLVDE